MSAPGQDVDPRLAALERENQALRKAAARDRAVLDSSTDFAIIVTNLDGVVTDWNTGAEEILLWPVEEMIGRSAEYFFTPEDRAAQRPEHEMQVTRNQGRAEDERWHLRADNKRFWASGKMMLLRDAAGEHVGYVKILRDRTVEHEARQALLQAQQENARVNAALQASEQQFRTFAQAMPNQIWAARPDGTIYWFNDQLVAYSGLPLDELLAPDGWQRFVHPDDVPTTLAAWQAARASGDNYEHEYRLKRADGAYRWFLTRGEPVRDDTAAITGWVGTNTDIDDQKRTEVASTADRDRLWSMSQDLMLVCTVEGEITAVNPSAARMLGWSEQEMVGQPISAFLHPEDLSGTAAEMELLARGITTLAFENRYRTKAGDYRLLAWTAVPEQGRIHGVGRDITDERRLVRERERIWRLSPVMKVVTDPEGVITDVNPSWTHTLGWAREETVGRRSTDFMVDDEIAFQDRVRTLSSGKPLLNYTTTLTTKAGDRRVVQWTTVPENGIFYGFGRDITGELEGAAALADAEAALRQSQKMEAVGQLTGGIAHDFNNLLTGITGSLELLEIRIAQGRFADVDKYVVAARGAAKRAASLTHRLLAFSRRQTLDPKPTDVNRLIDGMEDLVRRTVGPEIDLEVVGAAGLWPTLVDPNQLENAMLNLCINARDAMQGGGRLTIETGNRWMDRRAAKERDLDPGHYISLCVSDSGAGMTKEVIEKAFDPFFTTKPLGAGTGLGLSMVYGFARQSGGQVRIYSEEGEGTTVCIYLPRHHAEANEMEEEAALSDVPRAIAGETVLVVDDEPTVRMLVMEVLDELGYAALEAGDGAAGLKILQSDTRIDLLVTDVGLPGGMNGRQMADLAREHRPDLEVLFVTSYAENAVVGNGQLDPGMHVMTKPFAMEALASYVRELIHKGHARALRAGAVLPADG
ncbi:PAS domain S-box protein [uncultured Sphingomonas sp.]|uniref:PAS domain S-box protein n=1 Tax=uncultured Sphingomonas sp. TaxID=158754 RepID=UPI0025DD4D42|nr:PAS domain S-box protein [uncultured Sphingomonas sp.]